MSDSLRDRIAYAIAQADGDEPGMEPASCDYEMADAVIAALGLQVQWRHDFWVETGQQPPTDYTGPIRYVTEWENDE